MVRARCRMNAAFRRSAWLQPQLARILRILDFEPDSITRTRTIRLRCAPPRQATRTKAPSHALWTLDFGLWALAFRAMSQMLKSSGAMAAATLVSRLLGMVREVVYANFMGDSRVAGAFKLAFTIPNLFRRLLGEGALTAAFIPIFKEKEKTHGEIEMWRTANAVISGLVVASAVVIALVMLGVSIALQVHEFSQPTGLMLRLLRVMFPYMLLVCLAAVL